MASCIYVSRKPRYGLFILREWIVDPNAYYDFIIKSEITIIDFSICWLNSSPSFTLITVAIHSIKTLAGAPSLFDTFVILSIEILAGLLPLFDASVIFHATA